MVVMVIMVEENHQVVSTEIIDIVVFENRDTPVIIQFYI